MSQARYEIGENLVIVENEDGQGDGLIRNTATGAEIKLGDFVDVAGAIGSESDPVSEGFFESVETESATVTNEVDAGSVNTEGILAKTVRGLAVNGDHHYFEGDDELAKAIEFAIENDDMPNRVIRSKDQTFNFNPTRETESLVDGFELIGIGLPHINTLTDLFADVESKNGRVSGFRFSVREPGSTARHLRPPKGWTFETIKFENQGDGGNIRYHYSTIGDDNKGRALDFTDAEFRDDTMRFDSDGNSVTNSVGVDSLDDRGTDNITSGNTPLDL